MDAFFDLFKKHAEHDIIIKEKNSFSFSLICKTCNEILHNCTDNYGLHMILIKDGYKYCCTNCNVAYRILPEDNICTFCGSKDFSSIEWIEYE